MRSTLFTLISFSTFTLCTSVCPMSMEMVVDEYDMGHEMQMAHMDMNHDEEAPCERCEKHSSEEVAITNVSSSLSDVVLSPLPFVTFNSPYTIEYSRNTVPKSHLAAAGPPVVPDIVSTIVLRT